MKKDLFERITDAIGKLSLSESKVAYLIVTEPGIVCEKSMAVIAARAEVSEPTVMRFCRSMGFSGFSEFKESFIAQLDGGGVENLTTIRQTDSIATLVHRNHLYARQQLKKIVEEIDPDELLPICTAFTTSSVIAIFTEDVLLPTAQSFQNCFLQCGLHSALYCQPEKYIDIVQSVPQPASLLFLSVGGQNKLMKESIELAKIRKLSTVSLTRRYSSLAAESDHVLYFPENMIEQPEQLDYINFSGLLLVNTLHSILEKMRK